MNTSNPSNPYAPPKAFVQDVADQNAAAELAGRGTRLGAYLLEALIGVVVAMPILFSGLIDYKTAQLTPENVPMAMWIFTVGASIAIFVLTLVWLYKYGQTIGKRILGIKIVRSDRSRAGLARIIFLRYIVAALPGVILSGLWNLIDALFIFGEKRQCVHDKIADTIVVKA